MDVLLRVSFFLSTDLELFLDGCQSLHVWQTDRRKISKISDFGVSSGSLDPRMRGREKQGVHPLHVVVGLDWSTPCLSASPIVYFAWISLS